MFTPAGDAARGTSPPEVSLLDLDLSGFERWIPGSYFFSDCAFHAMGIIAGTTSHYSRPFPQIKVHIDRGLVTRIEGGGRYGDAWRAFLEETKDHHYPEYPRLGLFWLWELAIGTNPKVSKPLGFLSLGSGGSEFERFRSGVIHAGFGTSWRMPSEEWPLSEGYFTATFTCTCSSRPTKLPRGTAKR